MKKSSRLFGPPFPNATVNEEDTVIPILKMTRFNRLYLYEYVNEIRPLFHHTECAAKIKRDRRNDQSVYNVTKVSNSAHRINPIAKNCTITVARKIYFGAIRSERCRYSLYGVVPQPQYTSEETRVIFLFHS